MDTDSRHRLIEGGASQLGNAWDRLRKVPREFEVVLGLGSHRPARCIFRDREEREDHQHITRLDDGSVVRLDRLEERMHELLSPAHEVFLHQRRDVGLAEEPRRPLESGGESVMRIRLGVPVELVEPPRRGQDDQVEPLAGGIALALGHGAVRHAINCPLHAPAETLPVYLRIALVLQRYRLVGSHTELRLPRGQLAIAEMINECAADVVTVPRHSEPARLEELAIRRERRRLQRETTGEFLQNAELGAREHGGHHVAPRPGARVLGERSRCQRHVGGARELASQRMNRGLRASRRTPVAACTATRAAPRATGSQRD